MAFHSVLKTSFNLPGLGGASVGVLLISGIVIYLLTKRKKNISLRI